jgi:hypothetical protein
VTVVRTIAAHEIVQAVYPHPVTEKDELGLAVGKAIDGALSQYSHDFREGRKPTATATNRIAAELLDEELRDVDLSLTESERAKQLAQVADVLRAFRRSEVMGMLRPRSRLVLIGGQVGFYAQPDYWDGRGRFFEMKSYLAESIPPAVDLQLRLFQVAFPGLRAFLVCFDRHSTPVTTRAVEISPIQQGEADRLLLLAYQTGLKIGKEKVLEYIDNPIIRYPIPVQ